jgi:adenosine deaminase CECR1
MRQLPWVIGGSFLFAAVGSGEDRFAPRFEEIREQASPEELYAFLYDLPKGGDLHNHLGGCALPETWWRWAASDTRRGGREFYTRVDLRYCFEECSPLVRYHTIFGSNWTALSDCCRAQYRPLAKLSNEEREAWLSAMRLDRPTEGREEFFEMIWARLGDLIRDPEIIAEVMVENMKSFAAEGLRYIEWQISPLGRRSEDGAPVEAEEVDRWFRERLAEPDARDTGVTVRFLASVLRFGPAAEEALERAYAFVARPGDLWVGVNLVGREDDGRGHPLRFLDVFRKMRRRHSGVGIAIHAGEEDGPSRHVRDTLLLGATRIGHGVNLVQDPEALILVRAAGIAVETSLVSNHLLGYTPDLDVHPFPEYLRLGIPAALSTDDRGIFDSSMTDEYFLAVTRFHLRWGEVRQLGRNSLEHAFVDQETKSKLLGEYERDVKRFEKRYLERDWREEIRQLRPVVSGYARRHSLGR